MAKQNQKAMLQEFATKLKCKPEQAASRLVFLGYTDTCSRCGGCGQYSYNQLHGSVCYGCGGKGYALAKLTADKLNEAAKRIESGELEPYFAKHRALAWVKKQKQVIWDTVVATNFCKLYTPVSSLIKDAHYFVNLKLYARQKKAWDLRDEAERIINKYTRSNADFNTAETDKAAIEALINEIKALDAPAAEILEEIDCLTIEQRQKLLQDLEIGN
jgi:hypothetical protein